MQYLCPLTDEVGQESGLCQDICTDAKLDSLEHCAFHYCAF